MSYQVRVHPSIEEIGEAAWQGFAEGGSLYLSYPWLRSVEGMLGSRCWYLTVWRQGDGRPLAGAPCYLVEDEQVYSFYNLPQLLAGQETLDELSPWLPASGKRELESAAATLRPHLDRLYPGLVCASPFGYTSTIARRGGLDPAAAGAVVEAWLDALDRLAEECAARHVAFLYVGGTEEALLRRTFERRGYQSWLLAAECVLPVRWSSFEEFLRRGCSRKRRETIRKEIRQFEEHGLSVCFEGVSGLTDELAPLQSNVHRKYGHRGKVERIRRGFERIRTHLGPFVRLSIARRQGEVLGFMLGYQMGETLYCKQVGFDYDRLGRDYCYFNVTFYEPLRQAIARGLESLHYGIGSAAAKVARGCRWNPLLGYCRILDDGTAPLRPTVERILELQGTARQAELDHLLEAT